ncbi:c-type cytochrome [Aromatoleum diolicum]|uniref:C-type cytochrome n=1 Tax=Aromatoleum diolicum TaxID=75796 RepID=A0ABX1QE97_9RHOO|nr:c-type cytochrome [Aromatoleum diolicum]NMG75356.1 c-type cytochrome [Aromatoleum diolicum]
MNWTGRLAIAAALLAVFCNTASAGPEAVQGLLKKAAADPATRAALIREGDSAAFFCKNCHGEKGIARFPEVPNLAAQNPAYIVSQIDAFLTGKRRNEFMQGLMKVLGDREKAAIAMFYGNAVPAASVATRGPAAAGGAEHYKRLCVSCHQNDAHGSESFARLAGQQVDYLRLSLKRYLTRTGERTNSEMSAAVTQLGEQNIESVVQYLASLK